MKKQLVGLVLSMTAVLGTSVISTVPAERAVVSANDHWCC